MSTCRQCGLDHTRLAVEIRRNILHRSANKERHLLRAAGGAWAFENVLLSEHPEVKQIEIIDRGTGELWRVERSTFDRHAFDFNATGRPQKALALKHWNTSDEIEHDEPDAEATQPTLIPVSQMQSVYYEPAKKPRPRLPQRRRGWG